jgi:hypothetical protein
LGRVKRRLACVQASLVNVGVLVLRLYRALCSVKWLLKSDWAGDDHFLRRRVACCGASPSFYC